MLWMEEKEENANVGKYNSKEMQCFKRMVN